MSGHWTDALSKLLSFDVPEPEAKLRWLFADAYGTGLVRGEMLAKMGEPLPRGSWDLRRSVDRLCAGEPVQYVVGECDFLDFTVGCDRRALIPRPETEEWVARAIEELRAELPPRRAFLADVCTGGGCIAAALARAFPQARILATDLSPAALSLARENMRRLGIGSRRVRLRQADLLPPGAGPFDAILSNPPYIATRECGTLERSVRDFEPRLALDGGADGLETVRRLVRAAARALRPGGWFWMEIGDGQAAETEHLLWQTQKFNRIRVRCDFAGRARCAEAHRA